MMYIYSLNLIYLGNKIFKKFFAIGSIILVFATLANIIIYFPKKIDAHFIIFLGLALLAAIGLIYTLFFALKFDDHIKYREQTAVCKNRCLCLMSSSGGAHDDFNVFAFISIFKNETGVIYVDWI